MKTIIVLILLSVSVFAQTEREISLTRCSTCREPLPISVPAFCSSCGTNVSELQKQALREMGRWCSRVYGRNPTDNVVVKTPSQTHRFRVGGNIPVSIQSHHGATSGFTMNGVQGQFRRYVQNKNFGWISIDIFDGDFVEAFTVSYQKKKGIYRINRINIVNRCYGYGVIDRQ